MAKSQTKQGTQMSKDIYGGAPGQFQPIIGGLGGQQQQAQSTQQTALGSAMSGYGEAQTTGGFDPTQLSGLRSTSKGFTETGGYDPTQLQNITQGYQALSTGGYTPEQEAAFINVGTSGIGSTYDVLKAQQQRQRAAQGLGMGGGEFAQMAREGTAAQEKATLDSQVQLQQIENANKVAGLGGLAQTQKDVASAKQAGFGEAANIEGAVAANKMAANAGMKGIFDTATGQLTTTGQQLLNAVSEMYGVQLNSTQLMQELSKNPGLFQTLVGDIGTIGGAAAGAMGGLGGLGLKFGASAASKVPPGLGEG